MTTCHRSHFEHLCRRRGYALADAMPCVVAQDGDQWTIDTTHRAYPRQPATPWRPIPIGDVVERWLTRIGLSKDRVQRWTRRVGVKDCGCASRQKWLNEVGNELQRKARAALLKARRFYVGA